MSSTQDIFSKFPELILVNLNDCLFSIPKDVFWILNYGNKQYLNFKLPNPYVNKQSTLLINPKYFSFNTIDILKLLQGKHIRKGSSIIYFNALGSYKQQKRKTLGKLIFGGYFDGIYDSSEPILDGEEFF